MNPEKFIVGNQEITQLGGIMVKVRPAETSALTIGRVLENCERREEKGFVSGIYNFNILMDALRDLDQERPIELSLSVETAGGRARLLKIVQDETTIYLVGRTRVRDGDPEPSPDALTGILLENQNLRERIAELELRAGGCI